MHDLTSRYFDLTRLTLALALLVPACGPGNDTTAGNDTTFASADTTDATAGTTTTNTPTTGEPPDSESAPQTTGTSAETGDDAVPCPPDDSLPPEGSPCDPEGATCDPFADPCKPYTSAVCTGGQWTYNDVGPGDPNECSDSCDPFPEEGQPCNMDGSFCSDGCTDQCSFCNALMCSEGTWMGLEVFPAPCLDCDPLCDFTLVPMCAAGPPDKATCVAGCMDAMAGPCNVEFSDLRACAGDQMPTFTCDAMDRPTVAGCEAQFDAFYACSGF